MHLLRWGLGTAVPGFSSLGVKECTFSHYCVGVALVSFCEFSTRGRQFVHRVLAMGEQNQKRGGKAPRCPAPPPSPSLPPSPPPVSSSDGEEDFNELRAMLAHFVAREKEKALRRAGRGDGGGVSGTVTPLRRSTRKGRGAKLSEILSSRKCARGSGEVSDPEPSTQVVHAPEVEIAGTLQVIQRGG